MEQGKTRERRKCADDDIASFGPQRLRHARWAQCPSRELLRELGSLDQTQPREQSDDINREGDEERITPAPVEKILRRQLVHEEGKQGARHDQAARRRSMRPGPRNGHGSSPAITPIDGCARRGEYLNDRETLVQAVTRLGAGFWVLTPLRTVEGFTVRVNCGFVPLAGRDPAAR